MTPDERYDRMERLMEFLMEDAKTRNRDIEALIEFTAALRSTVEKDGENIRALLKASAADGENIRALARIAEIHEHRLSNVEEKGPKG